jgi:hypothetical protein
MNAEIKIRGKPVIASETAKNFRHRFHVLSRYEKGLFPKIELVWQ